VVDVTGTISLDGTPLPAPLQTPGMPAVFTFTGTQNQRVSAMTVVGSGAFGFGWTVTVKRADTGDTVGTPGGSSGTTAFMEPVTLPIAGTGTYQLIVDPVSNATGTAAGI
jgi:hypothetical protein